MIESKPNSLIKAARIISAFGIRGFVRVFLFSDNVNFYCFLDDNFNEPGSDCKIIRYIGKNKAIVSIDGVCDRRLAESLKKKFLYVKKDELEPSKEGEFYVCDLIGKQIKVIGVDSIKCVITNVFNFGAGDLLEISSNRKSFLVPFTKENFPDSNDEIYITNDAWNWYKD